MKKQSGIFSTILLVLLLIALLVGLICGALYLTNGGLTDVRLIDIVTEDNKIIDNTTIYMRDDNSIVTFKAVSKLPNKKMPDIKVVAIPNNNADTVQVIVAGELRKLSNCKNFTAMFDIEVKDNIITVSTDWDIQGYLADYNLKNRDEIEILDFKSGINSYIDLQFVVGDLKIACNLIDEITVKSVDIDKDNILIKG